MKKLLVLSIVISIVFTLIGIVISCTTAGNPLIGTWRYELGDWWQEITFNRDMTYSMSVYLGGDVYTGGGTYSYTSTTFTLMGEKISVTYDYEIIGSNLYITIYDDTMIYVKQ